MYPILLLLSKMRPSAEEVPITALPSQSITSEEVGSVEPDNKGEFSRQADISLFVSLVESCKGQASQKVSECRKCYKCTIFYVPCCVAVYVTNDDSCIG